MRSSKLCGLLVLIAASGCYSNRTAREQDDGPIAPPKAKMPSAIVPQAGEQLNLFGAPLGDMDGDGFEDFLIQGLSLESLPNAPSALYLFYGRPEFPPQLSTADADAVFDSGPNNSGPIGDLNGDGLADLTLSHDTSTEFVFGRSKRLRGNFKGKTVGVRWENGELPPPAAPGLTTQLWVQPARDIDGDGCDDLLVNATIISDEGGLDTRGFLVRGHKTDWESAVWDPSWAVASFGGMDGTERLAEIWPQAAGDLDDDGHADLLSGGGERSLVFYGGSEFQHRISAADADAQLMYAPRRQDPVQGPVQSMIAGLFGDVDRDGMDDLVVATEVTDSVGFVYGRRWSGELEIQQDFTLEVELPEKQYMAAVGTADLDGDDRPEILASVAAYDPQAPVVVYVVRAGKGERLEGRRRLLASERWITPEQDPSRAASGTVFHLGVGGDVDGDGAQDILTHLNYESEFNALPVYLIPSTARARK